MLLCLRAALNCNAAVVNFIHFCYQTFVALVYKLKYDKASFAATYGSTGQKLHEGDRHHDDRMRSSDESDTARVLALARETIESQSRNAIYRFALALGSHAVPSASMGLDPPSKGVRCYLSKGHHRKRKQGLRSALRGEMRAAMT